MTLISRQKYAVHACGNKNNKAESEDTAPLNSTLFHFRNHPTRVIKTTDVAIAISLTDLNNINIRRDKLNLLYIHIHKLQFIRSWPCIEYGAARST
jgi:hypothetical protein